jgi:MarR family transcriptional regulator for hemolysin
MIAFTKCINTISRCTMRYREEQLFDREINGIQCTYLLHLSKNPGISQDALAEMIYINKSNVTRQLAVLEEHGFVVRKNSETDHRVVEVSLTPKAQAVMPKVRQVLGDWNDYLTEELTEEEKTVFYEMLQRITEKAKRYVDGMKKASIR